MLTSAYDSNPYTTLVERVLVVADITTGNKDNPYLFRYRGRLRGDSQQAYDQLAADLRPANITPLFQPEGDQHVILLLKGTVDPKPSNPWINLLMFALTVVSMLFAGALFAYNGPMPGSTSGVITTILANWRLGIPFAASLLAILLAHEFGHYLAARYHKTHVTLPYFIPFPLSPLGTMGAFIQLKERPKNKRILHDIGVAGPLAGLVIAVPLLIYGLSLSEVSAINGVPGQGFQIEGNSILYLLSKFLVFRQWLPEPLSFDGLSPLIYWIRYFFTGQPLPLGGMDVMIHPVAWAAWAGLLVTALNLIPAGQLDGGHLIYVLVGDKARLLWPFVLGALALLGFAWSGWWLWAVLILFLGRRYAEPLDQITPLDTNRRLVAAFGLVVFILVFTPVPLMQFSFGG